jgi:3-hydroxy-9,10-secoandrosta-1,3,5(10)-triene-9,17-dione monooxygenase reductase component
MIHVSDDVRNTIGKALGRIPSGLFVLTAAHGGQSTAMLASWVQQTSFQPPTVTIAITRDRPIVQLISQSGKLALSIVPEKDTALMKRYARGVKPDEDAFEGMKVSQTPAGLPVFSDAVAWLECSLLKVFEFNADHDLYVAQVTAGQLLHEGQSFTHQRGNGFHY